MRPLFVVILLSLTISAASAGSSGFANVNGTKLYYETAGKGRTVVFIHGGLVDSRLWDDQFKVFARKFRVVRYDLRGYGRSEFPTAAFSHVEDLYALLQYLKVKKASLVGLSVGSSVAMEFALAHPEMVEKIILTSAGLRGSKLPPNKQNLAIYKAAEEKGMEMAIGMWLESDLFATAKGNDRFVKRTRQMLADNYKYWGPTPRPIPETWPKPPTAERLSELKSSTLIIVGEKDAKTILDTADILKEKIAAVVMVTIPGVSHHLNMENPKEYNRIVIEFLKRP